MSLSKQEREELRLLASQATPGPWREGRHDMQSYDGYTGEAFTNIYVNGTHRHPKLGEILPRVIAKAIDDLDEPNADNNKADAAYIVAACNAIPALLDALEAAERERDALKAEQTQSRMPFYGGYESTEE